MSEIGSVICALFVAEVESGVFPVPNFLSKLPD
jgi:hypothetical protein